MWGLHDPLLEFWDTPNISGTVKARNLTRRWMAVSTNEKVCKIRSKGVMWVSHDTFWEFWDPLYNESHRQAFTFISDDWMT